MFYFKGIGIRVVDIREWDLPSNRQRLFYRVPFDPTELYIRSIGSCILRDLSLALSPLAAALR